ncbi:alpha/beta hydrolase [Croceicoccus ponticola]|uniref:Alpha/beta hydrolase n=1 Tax=Croceicoccus ponticola TaxID=2217664 RepID=A0A437H1D4_9SPHN|nr:alpha/beta hydrolase [Croceicoccus ponticola]RVQ69332.1 alpha/beta hydrolase [Croceicoccus ponticola]
MKSYEEHRYRSADGRLGLFARDYPSVRGTDGDAGERQERGGLPLLLMHGLTRNAADFEPLAPHLADYRLIVPDQRGRGLSDYDDDAANYRIDVYVADMFALLADLGIDRFGIVGTSMGGLIGMVMAAIAPQRVAALALNDIGPVIDEAGLDRIRAYVGGSPSPAADWAEMAGRFARVNGAAFPEFGDAEWLAFARRTSRETADGIVTAYDPAIAKGLTPETDAVVPTDLWPVWDMVTKVPVLVVRGGLSDLMSAETMDEMARRHDAAFEPVVVPNRGHAPLLDEPEVLAALPPFLCAHAR